MHSIIIAGAAAVSVPACAQQQDGQLWLQANTNAAIAKDLQLTVEQIARFSDRQQGLYQTEFGGLLGYRATPNIELGFGYRRVDFFNANTAGGEHRLRQHIVATFGPLTTRLRVDQRFSSDAPGVGIRIRPLLRFNHRLHESFTLFVSHESFFLPNSTRWGQRSGYERARNIIGVTVPVGRFIKADVGYLNQFRLAQGNTPTQMEHALNFQFTFNLTDQSAASVTD
ncbi:hypothetical protein GCM10007973_28940 [Polymorphobacter multimanifer]|nr:hypothetical protein GCM10007973_28940 [Polymorphobacter multimanifer]